MAAAASTAESPSREPRKGEAAASRKPCDHRTESGSPPPRPPPRPHTLLTSAKRPVSPAAASAAASAAPCPSRRRTRDGEASSRPPRRPRLLGGLTSGGAAAADATAVDDLRRFDTLVAAAVAEAAGMAWSWRSYSRLSWLSMQLRLPRRAVLLSLLSS